MLCMDVFVLAYTQTSMQSWYSDSVQLFDFQFIHIRSICFCSTRELIFGNTHARLSRTWGKWRMHLLRIVSFIMVFAVHSCVRFSFLFGFGHLCPYGLILLDPTFLTDIKESDHIASLHYQIHACDNILEVYAAWGSAALIIGDYMHICCNHHICQSSMFWRCAVVVVFLWCCQLWADFCIFLLVLKRMEQMLSSFQVSVPICQLPMLSPLLC